MIEGVTRAKGLRSLASELGFGELSNIVRLGTDSSAAKSFVCRRGLGRMRHLEIRDLWLQDEVAKGQLVVYKVLGTENPADLMTKFLSEKDIESRLERLGLKIVGRSDKVDFTKGEVKCIGAVECRREHEADIVKGIVADKVCVQSTVVDKTKGKVVDRLCMHDSVMCHYAFHNIRLMLPSTLNSTYAFDFSFREIHFITPSHNFQTQPLKSTLDILFT
jgi:hypothetical protein